METATVATAAGMAMLLYFVFSRRLLAAESSSPEKVLAGGGWRRKRAVRRPTQPPANWREAAATLAETLRFTYGETLGKWPIGDLAFGIKYLMRRQGNAHVASIYAGPTCTELKGKEIMLELIELRRLIDLCYLFSKKPFPVFCEIAGYEREDALLQEPKAGILKPAFTILRDSHSKSLLLIIRGTHSMKDTLTAVTGAVVPFHHSLVEEQEGGVSKLVLGYAHCGMVAAARWIGKMAAPCLREAVEKNPGYKIKIVGHSMGGGTAALLTYIMREHEEFLSTSCVAFAPAACMTWELAESGKPFITAIVNGTDLVPTFSTASIDDLRSEVTASSWINDLRDQVQQTPFLNVVYRSASALGSRLPSISSARDRVAGAGQLLRPVSTNTQVVIKRAQNVAQAVAKTRTAFSSWSCIGARRRAVNPNPNLTTLPPQQTLISIQEETTTETLIIEEEIHTDDNSRVSDTEEEIESAPLLAEKEEQIRVRVLHEGEITEGEELWYELEKELQMREETKKRTRQEMAEIAKEIIEEEKEVLKEVKDENRTGSSEQSQTLLEGQQRFYPPGRIMHMVVLPTSESENEIVEINEGWKIGIYETQRELYSKIRLSKNMINDHYMPVYKKMMEALIEKFAKEEEGEVGCIDSIDTL
ncbi:hypothetical protein LUZ60_003525 [Juncus effusus]|nr:hypothetical protein LUZ60_003525 [Juncus effusus]